MASISCNLATAFLDGGYLLRIARIEVRDAECTWQRGASVACPNAGAETKSANRCRLQDDIYSPGRAVLRQYRNSLAEIRSSRLRWERNRLLPDSLVVPLAAFLHGPRVRSFHQPLG